VRSVGDMWFPRSVENMNLVGGEVSGRAGRYRDKCECECVSMNDTIE